MIESKIVEKEPRQTTYPCFKECKWHKGLYVLFVRPSEGFVLYDETPNSSSKYQIGHFRNSWGEYDFIETTDEIVLRNK